MVRQGEFELRLVRGDGMPCPEVEHNGRTYAVASSSTTFVVQIIKHLNPFVVPTPGIFHNVSRVYELRPEHHGALSCSARGSRSDLARRWGHMQLCQPCCCLGPRPPAHRCTRHCVRRLSQALQAASAAPLFMGARPPSFFCAGCRVC